MAKALQPAKPIGTMFADPIRASSPCRLHQQAGQTTAPDPSPDHHFMLATREPSTDAIRLPTHHRSLGKLMASPKSRHAESTGVSPRRPHWRRLPQEPRSGRPGSSPAEAAAFVADRVRGKSAASGGTESRRGYQECKARAKPEPLEKLRSL